jgi:hypothetical protein
MVRHSIPKSILMFTFLASLFLCSPLVHAADQLPPEAREAFDKGMAAVEQKEWLVAADSFSKAWKISRSLAGEAEPELVFNWALAESKIAGRELRATACFNYYLNLGEKEPPNAAAVRKEKTALEVRTEARLRQLFSEAKKVAGQAQGSEVLRRNAANWPYDLGKTVEAVRRKAYIWVAQVQAWAGDFTGAVQTADTKVPPGFDYKGVWVFDLDVPMPSFLEMLPSADESKRLHEVIAKLRKEAEKFPERNNSRSDRADNLRGMLANDEKFSKASLTDPAGTLQSLADKKQPDDIFYGVMSVIQDIVFVLRRVDGQMTSYNTW